MNFKINGKDMEIKFTFNSFQYMTELDFGSLEDMGNKPFAIAPLCQMMVLGGVNHNPKRKPFGESDVAEALEVFLEEDGNIVELFEGLMEELEKSSFFKSLQKTNEEK